MSDEIYPTIQGVGGAHVDFGELRSFLLPRGKPPHTRGSRGVIVHFRGLHTVISHSPLLRPGVSQTDIAVVGDRSDLGRGICCVLCKEHLQSREATTFEVIEGFPLRGGFWAHPRGRFIGSLSNEAIHLREDLSGWPSLQAPKMPRMKILTDLGDRCVGVAGDGLGGLHGPGKAGTMDSIQPSLLGELHSHHIRLVMALPREREI